MRQLRQNPSVIVDCAVYCNGRGHDGGLGRGRAVLNANRILMAARRNEEVPGIWAGMAMIAVPRGGRGGGDCV